jgi:hypothetical protein
MSSRVDFTTDEWDVVVEGPTSAGLPAHGEGHPGDAAISEAEGEAIDVVSGAVGVRVGWSGSRCGRLAT